MKYYSLESLIENNYPYHSKYRVTQADVDEVNRHIDLIIASRNQLKPVPGDVLQYTSPHGQYHPYAHIDIVTEDSINICESGTEPFIEFNSLNQPLTNKSGGGWANIKLPVIAKEPQFKGFKIWGHSGPAAYGALYFYAEVNTWEYCPNYVEYSTKDHDKYHLTIREQPDSMGYLYFLRDSQGYSHTAFKNKEDYQAWFTTFNGKVPALTDNLTIWTDKQESHCIPLESYLEQDGVIDTQLLNGSVQECKRVYREGRVITYAPYQADRIDMPGELPYRNARLKNK